MGWFSRKKQDKEQKQRDLETQKALQEGRLPPYVIERISKQKAGNLPWSSNLSVSEWLSLKQQGLKPLGMVMGSSFYHIGYSMTGQGSYGGDKNLTYVEQAMYENRTLALDRMRQEASELGAHAVVDVKLHMHQPEIHGHETEFVAVGTAVALEGREAPSEPLLCNVSGMDFVKLLNSGTWPVGIAIGIAIRYQFTTRQEQRTMDWSWSNQEMRWYTEAVYTVRHQAIDRLREEGRRLNGTGILAHDTNLHVFEIEVERGENDKRTDHILEFISLGTVIREARAPYVLSKPEPVLDMRK